jgi:hypothetical protein
MYLKYVEVDFTAGGSTNWRTVVQKFGIENVQLQYIHDSALLHFCSTNFVLQPAACCGSIYSLL